MERDITRAAVFLGVLFVCQLLFGQSPADPAPNAAKGGPVNASMAQLPSVPLVLAHAQLSTAAPHHSWGRFWVLTATAGALTVADIELSQACLQRQTCSEANPLLPRSRAAAYAVQLPLTAAATWFGYHMKRHHTKRWWAPQVGLLLGHAIGAGSGARAAN